MLHSESVYMSMCAQMRIVYLQTVFWKGKEALL